MSATTCPHCGARQKRHHRQYYCMTTFDSSGAVVYQGKACMRIELNAAKRRIERLKAAGDDIFLLAKKHAPEYWLYTQTAFNNWTKAKEDKL